MNTRKMTRTIIATNGTITLVRFGTSYNIEQDGQPTKHYMSLQQGLNAFFKVPYENRSAEEAK